jgi:hypothetical protein
MKSQTLSRVLLVASVVLYLASLTQNAFCLQTRGSVDCKNPGWYVLAFGWFETLDIQDMGPFVALPWFANPCLMATWTLVLASVRRLALVFAGVGSLLALSFLRGVSLRIPTPNAGEVSPVSSITAHGPGYWLWLGSLGLAFLSAVFGPRGRSPRPHRAAPADS